MNVGDFAGIGDQDREFWYYPKIPKYATNEGKRTKQADTSSS